MGCTGVGLATVSRWLPFPFPPGDPGRYPTEPRTFAAFLGPCGAYPTHDQHRFTPNARSILKSRLPCGASTDACLRLLDLTLPTELA
ncbi:hypothetical protein LF1_55880 [Rubripirellula obstinata]|uniref:Uncharacterized protein n=1 Tax=Rubripirellula obstinata TaxID=406547 RepID=A0A5B1C7U9_9BACT|nr:hypothetical protein LF1_55880 [Rubripirellula obstinata]